MDDITKICTRCKEDKPATTEYFYKKEGGKYGLFSRCIKCIAELHNEQVTGNPDKFRQISKNYRLKYPERRLETCKRYRENNRHKTRESNQRYYNNNPDKRGQWRKKNPDKARLIGQRRIARINNLPYTLTLQEWEDIKAEFNYSCAYCGKAWFEIEGVLALDHVVPVKQGGGYTKENIVPACGRCNSTKHDKTPEQAGMPIRWPERSDSS